MDSFRITVDDLSTGKQYTVLVYADSYRAAVFAAGRADNWQEVIRP